jgi:hypothetical protein
LREVQAPDGRVWRVRRRWLPKQPRRVPRSIVRDGYPERSRWWWWGPPDFDFGLDGLLGAIGAVVTLVFLLVFLLTIVFPLIAFTLELLLFVVLATAGVIGRLVFGRPWRIEAATIGTPRMTREIQAKGLRGSREAIDELALEISSGRGTARQQQ